MHFDQREQFTSRRYRVLALLFFVITICILDRQVLSVVAPLLREKFHLSNTQYGEILFCFLAGMTFGQIPAGIMMDRLGPRFTFILIVSIWSLANAAHIWMGTIVQFCCLRFILGLAESGAYSGGTKVIAQYFDPKDRAVAGGIFNSGSLVGAILAPPLVVFLTLHYGWRKSFLLPSIAGMAWIIPWTLIYKRPACRSSGMNVIHISQREQKILPLLAIPSVWGVILMRAFAAPVTNFYWYWLPEYFLHKRGVSFSTLGTLSWLPFLAGGIGNIGGGWCSSHLIQRGVPIPAARKRVIIASIALAGTALIAPLLENTALAIGCICIASLGINSFAANLIAVMTDTFPENYLARITSFTGVGDGLVSMAVMLLTGIVVDHFSYAPVFAAIGLLPLLSLAAYLRLVSKTSLQSHGHQISGLVDEGH